MELKGKISKIDTEMGYGFVTIPKHEDVFFSEKTQLSGIAITDLKVNDTVRISVKETERGYFAESLSRELPKPREQRPEVTL